MKIRGFLIFFCLLLGLSAQASYEIKGKVNLGDEWQPKIFMAAIDKLSDYYRTSSKLIINTAPVDSAGYFTLTGENLPNDKRFYRLYLMKVDNTDFDACLYVGGDDHNFVHLILDNESEVNIQADPSSIAPFGSFTIIGSEENQLMRKLSSIVFPSFYFYKIQFPTELRFSEEKLHADLKNFADTCQNPLVALAAVNNMDFDNFFEANQEFYLDFQSRMNRDLSQSIYADNLNRKVNYYSNEDLDTFDWKSWLNAILLGLLGASLMFVFSMKKRVKELEAATQNSASKTTKFTRKEEEIVQLIKEGKTNKEIASSLFVEVSTVKSHINKIYSKLGVKNREDALEALKP